MMMDLDNTEFLRMGDPNGMLSILDGFSDHCRKARDLASSIPIPSSYREFDKVMIAGLGGSWIGGALLMDLLMNDVEFPIMTCRNYTIPKFVDSKTLFFAISYSGDTEETLSAYLEAKKAGSKSIVITTGGRLKEYALKDGDPCVVIPKGMPPRAAIPYLLLIPLLILVNLGRVREFFKELDELVVVLDELRMELSPSSPIKENLAKQIAKDLYGLIPIIYGVEDYTGMVAYRWKTQFNENAKVPAFSHVFPELNHNEVVGWDVPKEMNRCFGILILEDNDDPKAIKRRIKITSSIMKDKVPYLRSIYARGMGRLAKIFSLIYIGDLVSVYLAILNGVDPYPVRIIDYLKEEFRKGHFR